jgi:ceramide glucosyltransferase
LLTFLGWAALFFGGLGGLYALFAAEMAARFLRRVTPSATSAPPVTLLKPLSGADPGLAENLESFCRQAYDGPIQIVFGVQDRGDPAIPLVRSLQAAHPDLDITLVVDATEHGANRKIANLINMSGAARHEILILSDSDIIAPPDYVSRITGALERPGVGVVTYLYVGQARGGMWSRLGAMAINYQFLPNAIMGASLGLAEPCMGSTIALTASVLREIGGFQAFRDHLADDYEIGRAVRALGYRIAMPSLLLGHGCSDASGGELISHEIRWGRTIRLIDGAGYFGSLVTYALPLAVIGATLLGFSEVSLALILAILISRLILKHRIDAATGTEAGALWLMPLRDVLSFVVFLASLTGASVSWRGRRYRVGPDGVLAPL